MQSKITDKITDGDTTGAKTTVAEATEVSATNVTTEYKTLENFKEYLNCIDRPPGLFVGYHFVTYKGPFNKVRHKYRYFFKDGVLHRGKAAIVISRVSDGVVLAEEYWRNGVPLKTVWHDAFYSKQSWPILPDSAQFPKDAKRRPWVHFGIGKHEEPIEEHFENKLNPNLAVPFIPDPAYFVGFLFADIMTEAARYGRHEESWIVYRKYKDGKEEFFKNGKLHRLDGPARVQNTITEWYEEGKLHRLDGPAVLDDKYKMRLYYKNGILHRDHGPAVEYADGSFEHYRTGDLHAATGAAVYIAKWNTYYFYKRNKIHRDDAPAVLDFARNIAEFWKDGKRLRAVSLDSVDSSLTDPRDLAQILADYDFASLERKGEESIASGKAKNIKLSSVFS